MGMSELPPPPEANPGNDLPDISERPPGPQSRTWLMRYVRRQAPMGPARDQGESNRRITAEVPSGTIVLSRGKGSNVIDVDNNRYVDLAAGFGSLLLGHSPEAVLRAIELQAPRLMQGLGDVYPTDAKIGLLERIARLHPDPEAQVILGQSGADAVTAAVKSAVLKTGRSRLIAFKSSYHGLSYGALGVTDLREGYRLPFADHLPKDVSWIPYPKTEQEAARSLSLLRAELAEGAAAAVIVEPILGRGGVIVPPEGFLLRVQEAAHSKGALVIADEIWTGLGRAGRMLAGSRDVGFAPDLICLGKGLGGGLPISACLGSREVMSAWQRTPEVVHTSTFAGAPLATTAALATLDQLTRGGLIERSREVGVRWKARLTAHALDKGVLEVRGEGMMLGLELEQGRGARLQRALLERGFLTTTGGGKRDVLVLTPPLNISEELLEIFDDALLFALSTVR